MSPYREMAGQSHAIQRACLAAAEVPCSLLARRNQQMHSCCAEQMLSTADPPLGMLHLGTAYLSIGGIHQACDYLDLQPLRLHAQERECQPSHASVGQDSPSLQTSSSQELPPAAKILPFQHQRCVFVLFPHPKLPVAE